MVQFFSKGEVIKGSDAELRIALFSPCNIIDVSAITDFTCTFYTKEGGEGIQKQLSDFTVSGATGTIVLQWEEMEGLDDGNIRYFLEYTYTNGDEQIDVTKDTSSNYYLKSPVNYTPVNFVSYDEVEEVVADAISASTAITEMVQMQVSAATENLPTDEEMNSAIESAVTDMATQTWVQEQGYLTEHQSLDDYYSSGETDAAIASAITNQQFKTINGSGITGEGNLVIESSTGETINDAGDGVTPIYISGGTATAVKKTQSGKRYGVVPYVRASDGVMQAGLSVDFFATSGSTSEFDGRVIVDSNRIMNVRDARSGAVGQEPIMTGMGVNRIVSLTQAQYNSLATKDPSTLYIING